MISGSKPRLMLRLLRSASGTKRLPWPVANTVAIRDKADIAEGAPLMMGWIDFPSATFLPILGGRAGESYRGRTHSVPVSCRHSFTAAARRLSI